jgi:hypothetical protein
MSSSYISFMMSPRLLLAVTLSLLLPLGVAIAVEGGQTSSIPDWPQLIQAHQDRLAGLESDQAALAMFVGTIGPAAALTDSAATLGAKGLPTRLANELLVPEITKSAQRLVAALATLQLADRVTHLVAESESQTQVPMTVPRSQVEWLTANGPFPSLNETVQQISMRTGEKTAPSEPAGSMTALALSAGRLAQEAGQRAMEEWWRLKTWKDRVRTARGQSRLCGTWQWVIHNHQRHHQEQKLSLLFPPPGKEDARIPGLAEIVVLGDTVYLRWEVDGRTQEDSLLFSKEGNRLEGTFVNSQGGWGSISGKRTASCTLQ